jgi:Glycosyltransferase family 87
VSVAARAAAARAARQGVWLDVAVVAAAALVVVPFALLRFVDGDEGDYLMAAALVLEGQLPYRDFLYTQTPLLPYVYGAWAALTSEDWQAARLLSAAFALALGALVYAHVHRHQGRAFAVAALALLSTTGLALAWLTPVKTQGLSTLLLFAAFFAASERRWVPAGLLLGLGIDVRLLLAAAVPAFAWEARRGALGPLAAGLALGLLPSAVFAVIDPSRFWFGVLGYHAERSDAGLVGDVEQKARIVAELLGYGAPDAGHPQFLLLLLLAGTGAVLVVRRERRLPFAFVIAILVGVASVTPTPTYPQYFAVLVPFLIVTGAEGVGLVRSPRPLALALAVAAFAVLGLRDVVRFVHDHRPEAIAGVEEVAAVVQRRTEPGERVLSSWPGYLFGTHAVPVDGTENAYAAHEAARFSDDDAHHYRMATAEDVEGMIRGGRTRIVVVKPWHLLPPVPDWEGALADGGYRVLERVHAASNVEVEPPVTIYEAPR